MTENSLSSEQIAAFDNDGFLIIRRFFAACEIAVIADCFDQVLADALPLGDAPSLVHYEQLYEIPDPHFIEIMAA